MALLLFLKPLHDNQKLSNGSFVIHPCIYMGNTSSALFVVVLIQLFKARSPARKSLAALLISWRVCVLSGIEETQSRGVAGNTKKGGNAKDVCSAGLQMSGDPIKNSLQGPSTPAFKGKWSGRGHQRPIEALECPEMQSKELLKTLFNIHRKE